MQSLENAVYDLNQGIPDLQEEYKMHLQKMKFVQESNRSILSIVEYQSEVVSYFRRFICGYRLFYI